jgi:hypothetical protein
MIKRKLLPAGIVAGLAIMVGLFAGGATAGPSLNPALLAPHGALKAAPVGGSSTSSTVTRVFSTATNEIGCGFNQGWWSTNETNDDCNTNYVAGDDSSAGFGPWHDYFTFDITGWSSPCGITNAYLTINEGDGGNQVFNGTGPFFATYVLWDVSTDPFTLSEKDNNPDSTIYDDLGSGALLGGATLPTYTSGNWRTVPLNTAGRTALLAARNNHLQFFTFGGSILGDPADTFVFGDTGVEEVFLTVTQSRLCRVS